MAYVTILKYNPYHDGRGRFTSRSGAGAAADAMLAATRANVAARAAGREQAGSTVATRSAAAGSFGRASVKVLAAIGSEIPSQHHSAILHGYSYPPGSPQRAAAASLIRQNTTEIDAVARIESAVAASGLTTHGINMRGEQHPAPATAHVPATARPAHAVPAAAMARINAAEAATAPATPAPATPAPATPAPARVPEAEFARAAAASNTAHANLRSVLTRHGLDGTDTTAVINGYHRQAMDALNSDSDAANGKAGLTQLIRQTGLPGDGRLSREAHAEIHAAGVQFSSAVKVSQRNTNTNQAADLHEANARASAESAARAAAAAAAPPVAPIAASRNYAGANPEMVSFNQRAYGDSFDQAVARAHREAGTTPTSNTTALTSTSTRPAAEAPVAAPARASRAARASTAREAAAAAEGAAAYAQVLAQNNHASNASRLQQYTDAAVPLRSALHDSLRQHLSDAEVATVAAAFARSGVGSEAGGQGAAALQRHTNLPEAVRARAQQAGVALNNNIRESHSLRSTVASIEARAAQARTDAIAQHMANNGPRGRGRPAQWMNPGSPQPEGARLAKIMADPAKRVKLHERHVKEFAAMGITIEGGGSTPAEKAKHWDLLVGGKVTLNETLQAMTGDTTSHMRDRGGSLTFQMQSRTYLEVSGSGVKVHGTQVRMINREFDFSAKHAYHAYLKFSETDTGAGRKLFRDSIPLYEKMGLKSVGVSPGLDGGAYAWTRFGFTSSGPSANVRHLGGEVVNGLSRLAPNPGSLNKKERKEYDAFHALINTNKTLPDAEAQYFPRKLTNIQPNNLALRKAKALSGVDADRYTQTKLMLNGKSMGYHQTSKLPKLKEKLLKGLPEADRANARFTVGKVKGFGKALLQDWLAPGGSGSWAGYGSEKGTGIIRFNDAENMKHVRKYAGIRKPRAPRAPRARRSASNSNSTVTAAIAAAGPVIQPAGSTNL